MKGLHGSLCARLAGVILYANKIFEHIHTAQGYGIALRNYMDYMYAYSLLPITFTAKWHYYGIYALFEPLEYTA